MTEVLNTGNLSGSLSLSQCSLQSIIKENLKWYQQIHIARCMNRRRRQSKSNNKREKEGKSNEVNTSQDVLNLNLPSDSAKNKKSSFKLKDLTGCLGDRDHGTKSNRITNCEELVIEKTPDQENKSFIDEEIEEKISEPMLTQSIPTPQFSPPQGASNYALDEEEVESHPSINFNGNSISLDTVSDTNDTIESIAEDLNRIGGERSNENRDNENSSHENQKPQSSTQMFFNFFFKSTSNTFNNIRNRIKKKNSTNNRTNINIDGSTIQNMNVNCSQEETTEIPNDDTPVEPDRFSINTKSQSPGSSIADSSNEYRTLFDHDLLARGSQESLASSIGGATYCVIDLSKMIVRFWKK